MKRDEIELGDLHSVKSLAKIEPGLNEGGIRCIIQPRRKEFIECGILIYMGRKPLIVRSKFLEKLREESLEK